MLNCEFDKELIHLALIYQDNLKRKDSEILEITDMLMPYFCRLGKLNEERCELRSKIYQFQSKTERTLEEIIKIGEENE